MNTIIMYNNYKRVRDLMGMKDSQIAAQTGIPRSTFTDWKQGRSCPKIDKMQKIADVFQMPIDAIFFPNSITKFDNTKELTNQEVGSRLRIYYKFLQLNYTDQKQVEKLIDSLLNEKNPN